MTKQYKDNIAGEAQESLVDALENIKSLLEKSESKLSAARESIALANSSSSKVKALSDNQEIPVLEEEIIPTLEDEEIIPTLGDEEIISTLGEDIEEIIPTLDSDIEADSVFDISLSDTAPTFQSEPEVPVKQGISSEDILELIDEFQDRLPALLTQTITNCSLANLEGELFDTLRKEINQLRNEIQQLDR
jgi:hypothetical protein